MTQRRSKFSSMLDAASEVKQPEAPISEPATAPRHSLNTHSDAVPGQRGRPRTGKRSDPDYEQTTAYVRRDTYRDIKIALLQEDQARDYSDLVEELLEQWLRSR